METEALRRGSTYLESNDNFMAGPGAKVGLSPDSQPSSFGDPYSLHCMFLNKFLVGTVGFLREKIWSEEKPIPGN